WPGVGLFAQRRPHFFPTILAGIERRFGPLRTPPRGTGSPGRRGCGARPSSCGTSAATRCARNASGGLPPLCVSCSLLAATHLSHPLVGLVGEDSLAFLRPEGRVGPVAASVALSAALPPAALLRTEPLIAAPGQEVLAALLAGPLVVGDRVVGHLGPHHMRVKPGGDSETVSDPLRHTMLDAEPVFLAAAGGDVAHVGHRPAGQLEQRRQGVAAGHPSPPERPERTAM